MRTFPTASSRHHKLQNVHYVPVEQRQFQFILMEFRTHEGLHVAFEYSGTTTKVAIAPLFAKPNVESALRHEWENIEMSTSKLYYNPPIPSAFWALEKHAASVPKKNMSDFRGWIQKQNSYSHHRPVRIRFLRNPYIVTKVMDVWECDLLDLQCLAK